VVQDEPAITLHEGVKGSSIDSLLEMSCETTLSNWDEKEAKHPCAEAQGSPGRAPTLPGSTNV